MNKPTESNARALFNYLAEAFEFIDWLAADAQLNEQEAAQYEPLFRQIEEAGQEGLALLNRWAHYAPEDPDKPHRSLRKALFRAQAVYGDTSGDDSESFPEAVVSFRNTLDKNVLIQLAGAFVFIGAISDEIPQHLKAAENISADARGAVHFMQVYAPDIIAYSSTGERPDWHETAREDAASICKDYARLVEVIRGTSGQIRSGLSEDEETEALSGIPAVDAEDRLNTCVADLGMYGRLLTEIDPEHGDIDTDTLRHLGFKLEALARDASRSLKIMNQAEA